MSAEGARDQSEESVNVFPRRCVIEMNNGTIGYGPLTYFDVFALSNFHTRFFLR